MDRRRSLESRRSGVQIPKKAFYAFPSFPLNSSVPIAPGTCNLATDVGRADDQAIAQAACENVLWSKDYNSIIKAEPGCLEWSQILSEGVVCVCGKGDKVSRWRCWEVCKEGDIKDEVPEGPEDKEVKVNLDRCGERCNSTASKSSHPRLQKDAVAPDAASSDV
ncbi:hypothetical protein NDU88_003348 [Pleurodeles waltl]|uniref:Uncharacterized protein n=1 Tax=Pleurodeles waltl TaxID=8319 RepID=A0AAV7RI84_PLEWA|nr:hypothetical protein NDU88_003348 [Pleurodeles waltl]